MEQLLNDNNIGCHYLGEDLIAISCPFCNKTCSGNEYATLNIDTRTGYANCDACKGSWENEEVLEKLNIKLNKKEEPKLIESNYKKDYQKEEKPFYKKPTVMSIKEIFSIDFGEQEWLVKDLIPIESPVLISGHPGNYKSWITQDIARCVALGSNFLGKFEVKQGSVLIVDRENHLRIVKKRLSKLQVPENAPIFYFQADTFQIDKNEDFNSLLETIKEKNIKLVIFDSLIRIHSGDENDAKQISKVLDKLKSIINLGSNVITIHHLRKENGFQKSSGNSIRGSSDILAFTDVAIAVKKGKEKNSILLETIKLRNGIEPEPFEIKLVEDEDNLSFQYVGEVKSSKEDIEEIKDLIISLLEENNALSTPEIIKSLNSFKTQNIRTGLKILEEEKLIKKEIGRHNKQTYSLAETII
ncbi:MAG: AAA family ATPase [Clostridia bacterium]|nr:AAA family ATPase [Clostridia bacterium]